MDQIAGYSGDRLWVPVSLTRLRAFRPLPAAIVSHVRNAAPNSADRPTASFDVTLATPDGEVCAVIEGFTLHRLNGALSFPAPDARALDYDDAGGTAPASPAEERLMETFRQGIRPEEAPLAFGRALATGGPQIFVSSLDLPALARHSVRPAAAQPEGQAFERPDLDTAYVAPRNDIEQRLVGFWQELLGLGRVGVEDSFFDLGGHSLIAVRLFAQVKRAFRVEFPISVLFEAPTIAACARMSHRRQGPARLPAASPIWCRCTAAKAARRRRSSWSPACSATC